MAIGTRSYARGYLGSTGLPPGIRWLLIANVVVFLFHSFVYDLTRIFGLSPSAVVTRFFLWQLVTYLFVHYNLGHIFWNMLALWMFGRDLETHWGTRIFMRFYMFCGIGAGLCVVLGNYLAHTFAGAPMPPTVGASGAIYGLLMASALLWPDRELLLYFVIPIKMKYFVMIIGAFAFYSSFNSNSPVSNVAHLGGMLVAYILLKMPGILRGSAASTAYSRRRPGPVEQVRQAYQSWKLQRAKKRFQVYLKKQGVTHGPAEDDPDRDRWVN
jgi:membrane associated rhomboid family serine protease